MVKSTDAHLRAVTKYDQKTYKRQTIRFRKDDEELMVWLNSQESVNMYIVDLIKKDMKKKKATKK